MPGPVTNDGTGACALDAVDDDNAAVVTVDAAAVLVVVDDDEATAVDEAEVGGMGDWARGSSTRDCFQRSSSVWVMLTCLRKS